jgi:hypothetical protein
MEPRRTRPGPLFWALLISLGLHATAFVGWEASKLLVAAFPRWFPEWVKEAVTPKPEPAKPIPLAPSLPPPQLAEEQVEIPLTFLEVDPTLVTKEAPKQTPFYSTENTLAGNPSPPKPNATQPRVEGKNKDIVRTLDVPRPTPPAPAPTPAVEPEPVVPPRPETVATPKPPTPPTPPVAAVPPPPIPQPVSPPQPKPQPQPEAVKVEPQPAGGLKPGATQLAKAEPKPVVERPQPAREARPATPPPAAQPAQAAEPELQPRRRPIKRLAEAREQKGIVVGEKMEQDGGVSRLQIESSLDVKASPFGNYDRQFIAAVQQRWYALLQEHHFAFERGGKVVLRFRLRSDGSVTDMTQVETQVGDVWSFICESAVLTQAPYAKWPSEMRRLVGADSREITFTFHYTY